MLWPCNVEPWCHWQNLQTQWRSGMGGATGLDYQGVRSYMLVNGLLDDAATSEREYFKIFQACEAMQLEVWAEYAARKQQ